jgi:hypothetical protein
LAPCDGDRERYHTSGASVHGIGDNAKVRVERARLGDINRAVNFAIHPMRDLAQYGEIDLRGSPLHELAAEPGLISPSNELCSLSIFYLIFFKHWSSRLE